MRDFASTVYNASSPAYRAERTRECLARTSSVAVTCNRRSFVAMVALQQK